MYKLEVGVFMYRYFANLIPESFNTFFTKRSDIHDYHTRDSCNLNQTRNKRFLLIKRSGLLTDPNLWNLLDDKIGKLLSIKHFRNSYKSSLIRSNIFITYTHIL